MKYSQLADLYSRLEKTSGKLEKTEMIAGFLGKADERDLYHVTILMEGRVFPSWDERELGIAELLMVKIITAATGFSEKDVLKRFKATGDFGIVAEELIKKKRQRTLLRKSLDAKDVAENIQGLAELTGKGSQERKFGLVSELLSSASPMEAKYIIRTVLGDLRIGVAEGLVRDAIAKAFFADVVWDKKRVSEIVKSSEGSTVLIEAGLLESLEGKKGFDKKDIESFRKRNTVKEKTAEELAGADPWKGESKADYIILSDPKGSEIKSRIVKAIEWAWFLRPDYGEIASIAKTKGIKGLEKVSLELGKPYHVLLSEKAPNLEEALESFERPAIEYKYDGARVIIEVKGEKVWIYTRRLENITKQFPDLVDMTRKCVKPKSCVIEGEMLAVDPKTGRPLPFQTLSQRVQRKYDIEEIAKQIPVQVNLFDCTYLEGEALFEKPLEERRKILDGIIKPITHKFQLAKQLRTKDLKKAGEFYKEALNAGQEGVIVKNLDAAYQPGRRVAGGWLKVKPTMENLDLAIIGGTWGTGKRTGWLGSLILGCRDVKAGKFLRCGMLGTGIREKKEQDADITFEELTKMLKPHITRERGNEVEIKPKVVIEVAYEEIQKSPNYESGYALRFPRFVRLRTWEKSAGDADTLQRIEALYRMQKGKGQK